MKSTEIILLGERVEVTKSAHWWRSMATGQRYMIGRTRLEALAELEKRRAKIAEEKETLLKIEAAPKIKLKKINTSDDILLQRYYSSACRAKRLGKAVMSIEEFRAMVLRANGKCELTGIAFNTEKSLGARVAPWAPSLDRIDNTKGYEYENCRLVCVAVNIALNEFGAEVLLRIAEQFRLHRFNGGHL